MSVSQIGTEIKVMGFVRVGKIMEQRFITKIAETEQEKIKAYSLRYTDMLKDYKPELVIESGLDYNEYYRNLYKENIK